jgi:hypothetical protein
MLLAICISILVGGIIWTCCDKWSDGAFTLTFAGGIVATASIIALVVGYIGVNGRVQKLHTRYEMLTYQYENDVYENDNDIGKRELIEDIQNWNEDLSRGRAIQKDFWIGVFVPNIYDQFEYISLEK